MASDGSGGETRGRRRRPAILAALIAAAGVFAYLHAQSPQEQHVRVVLGDGAPQVAGLHLAYLDPQGDVAREAQFTYDAGQAPRVVAHDPTLKNGDYRLDLEIDTRDGRRTIQRQVTLGGGSTQIDVSNVISKL